MCATQRWFQPHEMGFYQWNFLDRRSRRHPARQTTYPSNTVSANVSKLSELKELPPTQRTLLHIISSHLDPLGTTEPIVIRLQIIQQLLSRKNYKWDDQIANDDLPENKAFVQELETLRSPILSRHLFKDDYTQLSLHIFCDVSYSGFAAVAYFAYDFPNTYALDTAFDLGKARVAWEEQHVLFLNQMRYQMCQCWGNRKRKRQRRRNRSTKRRKNCGETIVCSYVWIDVVIRLENEEFPTLGRLLCFATQLSLPIFCDASFSGFAAVAYFAYDFPNTDAFDTAFDLGKARVAWEEQHVLFLNQMRYQMHQCWGNRKRKRQRRRNRSTKRRKNCGETIVCSHVWIDVVIRLENEEFPTLGRMLCFATQLSLHIFRDASFSGFAAVAYFAYDFPNTDAFDTAFDLGKARVAPLKQHTITKLELQAAVLGTRIANFVKREST